MIDAKEHEYQDDPKIGHADVRTRLKGAFYFFLGNGLIQGAIQIAPAGEGSPMGLIIMNPEQLKPKRGSLTFEAETGFGKTMIYIVGEKVILSADSGLINARWKKDLGVPKVEVQWKKALIEVTETFFCPDRVSPILVRNVEIQNNSNADFAFKLRTGIPEKEIQIPMSLAAGETGKLGLKYELNSDTNTVSIEQVDVVSSDAGNVRYWHKPAEVSFRNPLLDHYFNAAQFQLPAVISRSGVVDASIWQYNREWVRDHSFMALGLVLGGHHELARVLLERLVADFVSDDGDCIDSSVKREPEEVELDQNGELLYVLKEYALWTGDLDLISKYWEKLKKTIEFPLKSLFRHEASGLFYNTREFWERHSIHGIQPGIELLYQVFPAIGLKSAAILARLLNDNKQAKIWEQQAIFIKNNVLNHPQFALVNENGFIKRRNIDGSIQETITPLKESIPEGIPLAQDVPHYLNPDTGAALPIALGFVLPESHVTRSMMEQLEQLWNQEWDIGGYGRYHKNSEADAPGPWPFPSLFIARAAMETREFDKVWKILNWLNSIAGGDSGSWFEMYGQRIAPPYPQVGITPWTWGEMLTLCVNHILGIKVEENHINFQPRLLPGIKKVQASFPLRNHRIYFDIMVDSEKTTTSFKADFKPIESRDNMIMIPYLDRDIKVEAVIPEPG